MIALLVTGLLGSFHCVGMCGGFVLALDRPGRVPWRRLGVQFALLLGKACTYLLLGAVAGIVGAAALRSPWFPGAQVALSVLAGLFMVLAGFQLLGLLRGLPAGGLFGPGSLYERTVRSVANARGLSAPFAMGALMGLLPCPLVYAFLAKALEAGSLLGAVGTMALLGLTSAPALLLVGFCGSRLIPKGGAGAVRAAGVVVVLVGLVTVARGAFPSLHHVLHLP